MSHEDVFRPSDHKYPEQRFFDDFQVGERFYIPSRTMTEALFTAFQSASGDNHPIHYDLPYCQSKGHPGLLAHGYQVTIQTAAGASMLAHVMGDALIAFLDQSSRFLKPVYAGDTVYPELEITDLKPQRSTGVMSVMSTVHNQRGLLVMEGEQRYLLRRRPGIG
jgi:acyl dehydratase